VTPSDEIPSKKTGGNFDERDGSSLGGHDHDIIFRPQIRKTRKARNKIGTQILQKMSRRKNNK